MLKDLTYRKKNKLLLLISVAVLFLIYTLSISKTIAAYSDYNASKVKVESAKNAPEQARQLEKQLLEMNSKIGRKETVGEDIVQSLLELVTNYCQDNQAVLREFPEGTIANNGDLFINTNPIVVEGSFSTLVKLVYLLEQKVDLGKIASVKYALVKDRKSKEIALTATIYIQNIKKRKNDTTTKE